MKLSIDAATLALAKNTRYRGIGMVSANNSSRLLLDYKAQHPKRYNELLEHMFGRDGLNTAHLKIEMGSDINSSSGTEPCVMRHADEAPDVTRGAGFQLCADAKKVNPDLTIDMLWWSEPRWVTDAADVHAARYRWYRESLVAAYDTYGLEFDYVSANRNERAVDGEWIKYLSKALKSDTAAPYDFSKIKIVAADECGTWSVADDMLRDPALLAAVDVVGSHYTSHATPAVFELCEHHGKEIWFAEASAPMSYPKGTHRYDGNGSGLGGINGVLDIATRFVTMYSGGRMTLHEFQPVVSSYYDGVTYCHKHLIRADEPWSGNYVLDCGYWMCLHFSRFFKKGWAFVNSACMGDGKAGGDGHAIVDAVHSCLTAADPDTGDYSCVITNTTAAPITYDISIAGLSDAPVFLWETKGPTGGAHDENYFKKICTIIPSRQDKCGRYSVTLAPYSMITLSTLDMAEPCRTSDTVSEVMQLPYCDDFRYLDKAEDFLKSRGSAPLYTTDQGGAFEVATLPDGEPALMQMITPCTLAEEWGWTPKPTTSLGDDRWYNYSVTADVLLAEGSSDEHWAGIGVRYCGRSGWWLRLYSDRWQLMQHDRPIDSGSVTTSGWTNIKVSAEGNRVSAFVNGKRVTCIDTVELGVALQSAGRAAIYSGLTQSCYRDLKIEPLGQHPYIARFDDTDEVFSYHGEWQHITMGSFNSYRRTLAKAAEGASVTLSFSGSGALLTGSNTAGTEISISLDGELIEERYTLPETADREGFYSIAGLAEGLHYIDITVLSGALTLDAAEINV